MNMLYGLNKKVLAMDFRKVTLEELDITYNIKILETLYERLEEYLKLNIGGEKL